MQKDAEFEKTEKWRKICHNDYHNAFESKNTFKADSNKELTIEII